jgi:WG containing repeat
MHFLTLRNLLIALFVTLQDCGSKTDSALSKSETQVSETEPQQQNSETKMHPWEEKVVKTDEPNEAGFAITRIRDGESYREGIVDKNGAEVLEASEHLLVDDLTGNLAVIRFDRKSLFVTLDEGKVTKADLESVDGFQSANPFQCGHALVVLDDRWFYLDSNFEKAFGMDFEFAESFHHDRALVKSEEGYRIIDTKGKTVAELNYDQVNSATPWCWQVTKIEDKKYTSGFVGLNGELLTELIYDASTVHYQPEVQRIHVMVGNLHGFLDEHAKVVIPIQYESAKLFNRGRAKVVLNGRTHFINPDGEEVPE